MDTQMLSATLPSKGICALVVMVQEKKPMERASRQRSLTVLSPSLQRNGSPPSKSMKREPRE